jgi:hypothetical protein
MTQTIEKQASELTYEVRDMFYDTSYDNAGRGHIRANESIEQALTERAKIARDDAMEEAAVLCESILSDSKNGMQLIGKGFAKKIRALKGEKK